MGMKEKLPKFPREWRWRKTEFRLHIPYYTRHTSTFLNVWARFDEVGTAGSFSCFLLRASALADRSTSQLRRLSVKQAAPTYVFYSAHASDSSEQMFPTRSIDLAQIRAQPSYILDPKTSKFRQLYANAGRSGRGR